LQPHEQPIPLSILIVNYNVYADILKCIEAIKAYTSLTGYEIIVIDNDSPDRSIEGLNQKFPDVKLILLKDNRGFGAANNEGMKQANGEYFFLVNPDIIPEKNSIDILLNYLREHPGVGVVGPVQTMPGTGIERYYPFFPSLYSRLTQETRMFQRAPVTKQRFTKFWDKNIASGKPFKVDWVMGSAMMFSRKLYEQIGGFDEAFFLFEEETEWEYRAHLKGWERIIVPEARMIHNHHSSTSKFGKVFREHHEFRSRIIFWAKHNKGIAGLIRACMMYAGLKLRVIMFSLRYKFTKNGVFGMKKLSFKKLLSLLLSGRKAILENRFNFDTDIAMFKS
jgi:GT2 family glycosyltransferase